MQSNTYRQTKVAYIVKYVLWKWVIACFIYPAIYDYYKYQRNTLSLGDKAITLNFGIFTQNSREVPYKSVQSVNISQSVLGQMFNYGNVVITTANATDAIIFEAVDSPQLLKQAIQAKM